jgi:hypothetical protein
MGRHDAPRHHRALRDAYELLLRDVVPQFARDFDTMSVVLFVSLFLCLFVCLFVCC